MPSTEMVFGISALTSPPSTLSVATSTVTQQRSIGPLMAAATISAILLKVISKLTSPFPPHCPAGARHIRLLKKFNFYAPGTDVFRS